MGLEGAFDLYGRAAMRLAPSKPSECRPGREAAPAS